MSIVKNCVEVWSRLFDHKPFLQSELNSFIHSFEDNRKDREIVNLLDVLNIECEIGSQFDAVSNFDFAVLDSLNDKIDGCVKQSDNILKCDKADSETSALDIRRKERLAAWTEYKNSMEPKYILFDEELAKELEEVKIFYSNHQNNLK